MQIVTPEATRATLGYSAGSSTSGRAGDFWVVQCMGCNVVRSISGARASWFALLLLAFVAQPAAALTPTLRIESNQAGARFGETMANAGDVNGDGLDDLIVGAPYWDQSAAVTESGAAFLFLGRPGGFTTGDVTQADTRIESTQSQARLGTAVASAGDVNCDGYDDILIGAGGWDGDQADEGAAYIFLGGPGGIPSGDTSSADTTLQGDLPNARLGTSFGHADINADGCDDVIIGARLYFSATAGGQTGAAYIYLGGPTGIPSGGRSSANAIIEGDKIDSTMGIAVAGVGDVNGDGYGDMMVGAPRWTDPLVHEGGAFLYLGSATGIPSGGPSTADVVIHGGQTDGRFGRQMIGLGDVNGDGLDDVAIAATQYDDGQVDEGAVFVFYGGTNLLTAATPADAIAEFQGDQVDVDPSNSREEFGFGLTTGDWDGDGHTDLLISSPYYDAPLVDEGAAFVFRGSATGFTSAGAADADRRLVSGIKDAWMGSSVALVDVDGDGTANAFVGGNRMNYPVATQQSEGMVLGYPLVTPCQNELDDDGDLAIDLVDAGCTDVDDLREEIDYANGKTTTLTSALGDTILSRDLTNGAPTIVALDAGGSTTRDLRAIEHSIVRLSGGAVAGDLVASDSASAEVQSGSVAGSVVATGNAVITITGGSVVALAARDTARIELHGLAFALPDGDVTELAGTITGTLEDGTPISASYERDATATIRLVPEAGSALAGLAAVASLAALRTNRGRK